MINSIPDNFTSLSAGESAELASSVEVRRLETVGNVTIEREGVVPLSVAMHANCIIPANTRASILAMGSPIGFMVRPMRAHSRQGA